jgi:hypothetical protein
VAAVAAAVAATAEQRVACDVCTNTWGATGNRRQRVSRSTSLTQAVQGTPSCLPAGYAPPLLDYALLAAIEAHSMPEARPTNFVVLDNSHITSNELQLQCLHRPPTTCLPLFAEQTTTAHHICECQRTDWVD